MVIKMALGPKILFISSGQTTMSSVLHVLRQHLQVVLESDPSNAFQRWVDETPDIIVVDVEPLEPLALKVIS